MIDEAKAARAQTSLFYKKLIVVLVVLFAAMIISAVLATYFAKRPKEVANPKLLEYICQNLSYIKGNQSLFTVTFLNPKIIYSY